jgi:hypothetical protein
LPAPVTATRTPLSYCARKMPTSGKFDAFWRSFSYTARLGTGKRMAVISSSSSSAVVNRPWKKSSAAISRFEVMTVAPEPSTALG